MSWEPDLLVVCFQCIYKGLTWEFGVNYAVRRSQHGRTCHGSEEVQFGRPPMTNVLLDSSCAKMNRIKCDAFCLTSTDANSKRKLLWTSPGPAHQTRPVRPTFRERETEDIDGALIDVQQAQHDVQVLQMASSSAPVQQRAAASKYGLSLPSYTTDIAGKHIRRGLCLLLRHGATAGFGALVVSIAVSGSTG